MESKDIEISDLKSLEQDLTQEELVSIGFLLYASERPKWIFERLKGISGSSLIRSSLLEIYANYHDNWKSIIVEALGTIKAFECIQNLGIDLAEAREFVRNSSYVNSGVKLLYQLCEACPKAVTVELVKFLKSTSEPEVSDDDALEIHFLKAIIVGEIKLFSILSLCDFSIIKRFERSTAINDFSVTEVLKKFPSKQNALDTSINSSFNSSAREQNLVSVIQHNEVLDNYRTKKMVVLVINQQHFRQTENIELLHLLPRDPLEERKGTARDMEALTDLFERFKYHVIVRNDLTHIEVLKEVDKVTKQSSKYDGLIVCVLSHGHQGLFYGSDSVPVFVKDIKETMSSKVLLNKPKILLIQACQGDNLQPTVKKLIQMTEHDGPTQSNLISGSTRADFLTFWSTIEGFASVRHVENGTWFIQELVKKITDLHQSQHLMDICTSVINEVSLKRGYRDQCMLPKLESTFTKNFRFTK